MSSSISNITLIGLGNMGVVLGHTLLKSGHSLTIWNRTATRTSVSELVQAGATYEADLATAISRSPTTILCVLDYKAIHNALDPLVEGSSFLKGKTVINLTNGTTRDARAMEQWLRKQGVATYFDGAIMALPSVVGSPGSIMFASGETETLFNSSGVRDVIAVFGQPHYFGPDPGTASAFDLALLACMYGLHSGLLTALALIKKQHDRTAESGSLSDVAALSVDETSAQARPTLESRVTTLVNPLLSSIIPLNTVIASVVDSGHLDNNFGDPMGMVAGSMQTILRGCVEEGVDGGLLKNLGALMDKVVKERGDDVGMGWIVSELTR